MLAWMRTEPNDLDRGELRRALEVAWGLAAPVLAYLPLGFGSHHWSVVDAGGGHHLATVDDLRAGRHADLAADDAFLALQRAFRTAAALRHEAALEFVVAPLPDREGTVLRRLGVRHAVHLAPFVEGEAGAFGSHGPPAERRRTGALLGRLHAATDSIPAALAGHEDFALAGRSELEAALRDLDRPWRTGPFAEPTRRLLRAKARALAQRLEAYDAAAARLRRTAANWVVTHGEPHRGNLIVDPAGELHLIDWDTVRIAPRERDLQLVLGPDTVAWDAYRARTGVDAFDEDALQLYRSRWQLEDAALFVAGFRRPHRRTDDTRTSWDALARTLAR